MTLDPQNMLKDYAKYVLSFCIFTLYLTISINPITLTTTLKYGPKITGLLRGVEGGVAGPLSSKNY